MNRKLDVVQKIAKKKKIKGEINISKKKNKRFSITVDGIMINFGLWPYSAKGTYLDHHDE